MQRNNEKQPVYVNSPRNEGKLINNKIISDQIEILYQSIYVAIPGNLICASLIFIGLYQIQHADNILFWFACAILVMLFRLFTFYLYRYRSYRDDYYLMLFF